MIKPLCNNLMATILNFEVSNGRCCFLNNPSSLAQAYLTDPNQLQLDPDIVRTHSVSVDAYQALPSSLELQINFNVTKKTDQDVLEIR